MSKTTSKRDITRQYEIERMAREAAKANGILKALDQAIQHGEASAKEYKGAFEAVTDMTEALNSGLETLADEINVEKWG